jgi:hypothetical protein
MIAFGGGWKRVNDTSISSCPHCYWDPNEVEYTTTISYGPTPDEMEVVGELISLEGADEEIEPPELVVRDWDEAVESRLCSSKVLKRIMPRARSPPGTYKLST